LLRRVIYRGTGDAPIQVLIRTMDGILDRMIFLLQLHLVFDSNDRTCLQVGVGNAIRARGTCTWTHDCEDFANGYDETSKEGGRERISLSGLDDRYIGYTSRLESHRKSACSMAQPGQPANLDEVRQPQVRSKTKRFGNWSSGAAMGFYFALVDCI